MIAKVNYEFQNEVLRYVNLIADKYSGRADIEFNETYLEITLSCGDASLWINVYFSGRMTSVFYPKNGNEYAEGTKDGFHEINYVDLRRMYDDFIRFFSEYSYSLEPSF
ncbi:hypothetical protein HWD14_gp23 [Bifidobacterium phage BadAztec1]|uniref:Uncharacterized protein n=1 Tax=Bifidobacterium phage BadAztec1 TaxID=2713243 RepID=A0A6G6XZL9_9CAUD|nr:hypothetical protein HWD14_gp23 [Bifidobacterium phage BadAztec1]QIG78031.1 hypothetical protein BAAZ0010002c01_00023 [Bifidobacterium phage BadAztec1]